MPKQKFYTVWKGRETGVFASWDACKKQIDGFEGAQYKAFATEQMAREALAHNYWKFVGKKAEATPLALFGDSTIKPIANSISVDAACSGNPGKMEYRGVETATGKEIFREGIFDNATNNIGEFLAIVHALALIEKGTFRSPIIYSDSRTAQAWVRQKTCKTKLEQNEKNTALFELIRRAEAWLRTHQFTTKIEKWHTEIWGEIPADFGRK